MTEPLFLYSCIMLLSVFFSSVSQVMLKKASMREHSSLLQEYSDPYVLVAYAIFLVCTLLTVYSLKVVPLGLGAVLEATGYVYVTIFGVLIFKERFSLKKGVALALILLGICIFAFCG